MGEVDDAADSRRMSRFTTLRQYLFLPHLLPAKMSRKEPPRGRLAIIAVRASYALHGCTLRAG